MATAFAVYCADDGSVDIYKRDVIPTEGSVYEGKMVTYVYSDDLEEWNTWQLSPYSHEWFPNIGVEDVTSVTFKDRISPVSIFSYFRGLENITTLDLTNLDVSRTSGMFYTFQNCTNLKSINFGSNFDTKNFTTITWAFTGCESLEYLDLSCFDTSNVTNMALMFGDCPALRKIYVSDKWSMDKVTKSNNMFSTPLLSGDIPYDSAYTDGTYATYTGGYLTYRPAPKKMFIDSSTLYNIADSIRGKTEKTDSIKVKDFANEINNISQISKFPNPAKITVRYVLQDFNAHPDQCFMVYGPILNSEGELIAFSQDLNENPVFYTINDSYAGGFWIEVSGDGYGNGLSYYSDYQGGMRYNYSTFYPPYESIAEIIFYLSSQL